MRLSYFLMGCFVAYHFAPLFSLDENFHRARLAAVLMLFLVAFLRREWLVYPASALWLITLILRIRSAS